MEKRTREKVALVVFLLLAFSIAVLLLSYFSTGRSWNVAASAVDDTMGRMEGYTALVYPGTVDPDDAAGSRPDADDPIESPDAPNAADSLGLAVLAILPPLPTGADADVYVSDVRDLYERKEAQVVTLDLEHAERYREPAILDAGGKRIGVFSVDAYTTAARIYQIAEGLKADGVEAIVCIAPRAALLGTLDTLDVVVTTDDDEVPMRGADIGDAFVVQAPERGAAGIVVLSQSGVPSAKVIEAL